MKNYFVKIDKNEGILKEYEHRKLRVVITRKRLVIETSDLVFSIKLGIIGVVQMIRKSGKKYCLRLFSKEGKDLFPFLNNNRLDFLNRDEASEFESVLSSVINQEDSSSEE